MSVAIIGGADGPTAIYLASRVSSWAIVAGIVAVAVVVYGIYQKIKQKK